MLFFRITTFMNYLLNMTMTNKMTYVWCHILYLAPCHGLSIVMCAPCRLLKNQSEAIMINNILYIAIFVCYSSYNLCLDHSYLYDIYKRGTWVTHSQSVSVMYYEVRLFYFWSLVSLETSGKEFVTHFRHFVLKEMLSLWNLCHIKRLEYFIVLF